MLDCSTQNIYRQKQQLLSKGYMISSNANGLYITSDGIEYLKEKRIDTMRQDLQDLPSEVDNNLQEVASPTPQTVTNTSINNDLIKALQDQIQELKQDRDYWKEAYTKKDNELTKKVEYIEGINTKVFALLGTGEPIKHQEESKTITEEQQQKKHFWNIFKK